MAELATVGSVVGLISLSIQSCQGLTSFYSAWSSYDEHINQIHQNINELKTTCENLDRELHRITQNQESAVQQVVRLITSCQEGIKNLRDTLESCRSTQRPHSVNRALYPFRKKTLHTLKSSVRDIQGNLHIALQTLQL